MFGRTNLLRLGGPSIVNGLGRPQTARDGTLRGLIPSSHFASHAVSPYVQQSVLTRRNCIRLLSLDCTGTLFTWSASLGTLYHRGFTRGVKNSVGVPCSNTIDERFLAAFVRVKRQWPLYGRSAGVSSFEWWRAVARQVVEGSALANDEEDFEGGFAEVYRLFQGSEAYVVYSDTVQFLNWAREIPGLHICVISNVTESYRDAVLPALGLDKYIDFGIYSKLVGIEKPNPAIFHLAAKQAGVSPAEVLHIGNDFSKDILGARDAGCNALFLEREDSGRQLPDDTDRVRSLIDARQWIETNGLLNASGR